MQMSAELRDKDWKQKPVDFRTFEQKQGLMLFNEVIMSSKQSITMNKKGKFSSRYFQSLSCFYVYMLAGLLMLAENNIILLFNFINQEYSWEGKNTFLSVITTLIWEF